MISFFKIQNFKSIINETLFLNYAEGKAPNGYKESNTLYFIGFSSKRYVSNLMIFGANASGKTNILEAIKTLVKITKQGIHKQYYPNKLNSQHQSTLLEIEFFIKKEAYTYKVQYNQKEIIKETLQKENEILFSISKENQNFEKIRTKNYNTDRLKSILNINCSTIENNNYFQQHTFLNKVTKELPGLNEDLNKVIRYFEQNINIYNTNEIPPSLVIDQLSKSEKLCDINESFSKIGILVKNFDIDIKEFHFNRQITEIPKDKDFELDIKPNRIAEKEKSIEICVDQITTSHKNINNETVIFQFNEESAGTQVMFSLIGLTLYTLENGSILIIDELEKNLHPLICNQIIKLFKDKQYNTKNAQLIFTTHNVQVLEESTTRISEVAIVNKTLQKGTKITRLSDFKGIRNVTNFRKQYLDGAFAGIPFPHI